MEHKDMTNPRILKRSYRLVMLAILLAVAASTAIAQKVPDAPAPLPVCARTITADVVAFDQIIFYNRFGSFDPAGMMYALRRDVVPITGTQI
ncbi:MAG TPA: hypothetical protein VFM05_06075, partial [Candidatus Saccharimonadales bacterium]|nr:hypothetical protein [Candidatus Saccharimonadales bacterium]